MLEPCIRTTDCDWLNYWQACCWWSLVFENFFVLKSSTQIFFNKIFSGLKWFVQEFPLNIVRNFWTSCANRPHKWKNWKISSRKSAHDGYTIPPPWIPDTCPDDDNESLFTSSHVRLRSIWAGGIFTLGRAVKLFPFLSSAKTSKTSRGNIFRRKFLAVFN